MPTKTWRAKWNGHTIEVENWWTVGIIFNRRRCRLFIDGKCEGELTAKGCFAFGQGSLCTVLRAQLVDENEGTSAVRAEIRAGLFSPYLHTSINVGDECVLKDKSLGWGG